MRIALFISTIKGRNSGNGGHYRSLYSYYKELKDNDHNVGVLHYNELGLGYLDDKTTNLIPAVDSLRSFNKALKIILAKTDVVISFGESLQSRFLRYKCHFKKVKFIQVIAGGPNRVMPLFFKNCIYFSTENRDNPKDFSKNKFLLANRIEDYQVDHTLINSLEKAYPKKEFNILRVSRICYAYEHTFYAAIELHKFLKNKGVNVQTHIIGHIQDKEVYDKIYEKAKGIADLSIITENQYTNDVKRIMTYYNAAIVIGRGFGEAASKGLLVLSYNSKSKLPVIINKASYDSIREKNFSARVVVDKKHSVANFLDLFNKDSNLYKENVTFTSSKFIEDYSTKNLGKKLNAVIKSSEYDSLNLNLISMGFILLSEVKHRTIYFKNRLLGK